MLLKVSEYQDNGLDPSDKSLPSKLAVIEARIRRHTNNPFQVRGARFEAETKNGVLMGASPLIKKGDTVHVTQSDLNEGVYTVTDVFGGKTYLDAKLLDDAFNRVTLVRYPVDVVEGALGILAYEESRPVADTAGVASESLSRHAISYDTSGNETSGEFAGYPKRVVAFLKPYRRARF